MSDSSRSSVTPMPRPDAASGPRVVLITGASGAGRTTAIGVLEDLGYETIDNLPLSLFPRVLSGPPLGRPMALSVDVRNRDFSVAALLALIADEAVGAAPGTELLYLDCRPDVLLRRYSETRRRHPMAPDEAPEVGVGRETEMLAPLRDRADVLIDTSDLNPHDLRAEIQHRFEIEPDSRLTVTVQSFSYKRGIPAGIDTVFDCRFLRNPHWVETLRPLDGTDPAVQAHVGADPLWPAFSTQVVQMAELLLPAYRREGKTHLTIGFGCTGGKHRSVAMAEYLANTLAKAGWRVSKRHRELERRARAAPPASVG